MPKSDDDQPLAHPQDDRVFAVIRAVLLDNRWPKHETDEGVERAWVLRTR
jgi:hypothetical protein